MRVSNSVGGNHPASTDADVVNHAGQAEEILVQVGRIDGGVTVSGEPNGVVQVGVITGGLYVD